MESQEISDLNDNIDTELLYKNVYYRCLSSALSNLAKFDRSTFVKLRNTPASRIANEYVSEYLLNHCLVSTQASLLSEANNYVKPRHNLNWLNHKLRTESNRSFICQLKNIPRQTTTLPFSDNNISPVSTFIVNRDTDSVKQTSHINNIAAQQLGTGSYTRKIRVKVRKNKNGEIIEDPRQILVDKIVERISRRDRDGIIKISQKFVEIKKNRRRPLSKIDTNTSGSSLIDTQEMDSQIFWSFLENEKSKETNHYEEEAEERVIDVSIDKKGIIVADKGIEVTIDSTDDIEYNKIEETELEKSFEQLVKERLEDEEMDENERISIYN